MPKAKSPNPRVTSPSQPPGLVTAIDEGLPSGQYIMACMSDLSIQAEALAEKANSILQFIGTEPVPDGPTDPPPMPPYFTELWLKINSIKRHLTYINDYLTNVDM